MKYWFFAALLANVVFLLGEFHYGAFDSKEPANGALESEEKQILTVSEAASGLTPPPTAQMRPAENLSGLQERHETLPENPQMPPPGGEPALPTAAPSQAEAGTQTAGAAEIAEAAHDADVAKEETGPAARSAAPPATSAGEELTESSKIPEVADMPVQTQAAPAEQPANAPAESAAPPAAPEEEQTAVAKSPSAPETSNVPAQAQVGPTEQVMAQPGGEVAVPSESAMPQAPMPTAENQAPVEATANPEQTQITAQTQAAPADAAINSANDAAQQPPVVSEPEPPKLEVLQTACYTAGPVENAAALEALLNLYRPQLSALEFFTTEKRKNNTYLVYYPAAATIEQSIETAEMLRNNYGVSDLLVFRSGELKGMISLGVFSNEQRAKTAQSQFESKGVHAEIRPRYPLEVHYTMHLRWNEQQAEAAQQLSNALKKRFPGIRQTVRGCK